jgi:hypothetical protein
MEARRQWGDGGRGRQGSWGSRGSGRGSDGPSWRKDNSLSTGSGKTNGREEKEVTSPLKITDGGQKEQEGSVKKRLELNSEQAKGREGGGKGDGGKERGSGEEGNVVMQRVEVGSKEVEGSPEGTVTTEKEEGTVKQMVGENKHEMSPGSERIMDSSRKPGAVGARKKYKKGGRGDRIAEKDSLGTKVGVKKQNDDMELDEVLQSKKRKEIEADGKEEEEQNSKIAGLPGQPCGAQ